MRTSWQEAWDLKMAHELYELSQAVWKICLLEAKMSQWSNFRTFPLSLYTFPILPSSSSFLLLTATPSSLQ